MTDERDDLIDSIAQIIDYPSAYMGGPSRNSIRIAREIVKHHYTDTIEELRQRADSADRDRSRLYDALASCQTALTEARAQSAAAWEAAGPIRSLALFNECSEITGVQGSDKFGLYLLGDDAEPVYHAATLTFDQLVKIAQAAPADASAALQAVKYAEWNAALVAAADRLGHGYINTDHRGDTLFACNVVLDMRRKTEAE